VAWQLFVNHKVEYIVFFKDELAYFRGVGLVVTVLTIL